MRHLLVAATAGLLFVSGGAFAQSGQGGALGKNPAPEPSTSGTMSQPPAHSSGQGGYLGTRPDGTSGSSGINPSTQGSGQGGALGANPSGPGGNPAYTGQQQPPYGSQQVPPRR
jgi:hypothetical protein